MSLKHSFSSPEEGSLWCSTGAAVSWMGESYAALLILIILGGEEVVVICCCWGAPVMILRVLMLLGAGLGMVTTMVLYGEDRDMLAIIYKSDTHVHPDSIPTRI